METFDKRLAKDIKTHEYVTKWQQLKPHVWGLK